jgi:CRP/FNR family transcriptional regulator, cyclic AMP receptor protein
MTFSAHTERLHVLEKERNSANAEAGLEARIELLQRMPIFGAIRSDILQFLLASCPVVFVSANAFFFREQDEADSMFVIQAGKVAVVKSWGQQEHVLSILKEGDCFGEMAVMEHGQRSASVRAVEDCTAICISSANLHQLYALDLKQFTLIQMNMGREVCRRLREAGNQLFHAKMGMPGADSSSASP